MKTRTLLSVCSIIWFPACHSANWQPPETEQAPAASVTPPEPTPAANATPSDSASATPPTDTTAPTASAAPSTEPAPPSAAPAEATSAGAPTTGKVATKADHKSEEPAASADAYSGPDACEGKSFHYGIIGATCKKAGRKGVKEIMKGVVKKAKAAGQDIQCTSCHEDVKSFHLKSNAVSDLKQWL